MSRMKRTRRVAVNGRRGAFLLLFSCVYLILGINFLLTPGASARQVSLTWLTHYVPLEPFAGLWVVAGLFGVVAGFLNRPRDWFGFASLVFAPALWGAMFLIGGLLGSVPAFASSAVYFLFAAAPMIVSGMQGPHDRDMRKIRT